MDDHLRAAQTEHARVLHDIRIAEEQIARGEGIEHDEALQPILTRIRSRR